MYTIETDNLVIAMYRRKSSEGEDRQVASLEDQSVALTETLARYRIDGLQVRHDIGEAKSAKKANMRPGFASLVQLIRKGSANAILVWHPDRLSRNLGDVNALTELFEAGSLKAIITPQFMFQNRPMDLFLLASECLRAKLENDNKSVNVRRGLAGKVRDGWRPGVAPIGYLNDLTKTRGARDITIDEERFHLVRKVWDLLLVERLPVRRIRDIAEHKLRLRTRKTKRQGGKPLSLSHIYGIFKSPFYYGSYWWRNPNTGILELHKGEHVPMITEDEYRFAQVILGRKQKPTPKRQLFSYTGLMTCGECGCSITAEEKWQTICGACKLKFASQNRERCPRCNIAIADQTGNTILHYVYYHCTKKKLFPCTQKWVQVADLETQIDSVLKCFHIRKKYVLWAVKTLKGGFGQDRLAEQDADAVLTRDRTKLQEELAELNRFIVSQANAGWPLMTADEALAQKKRLTSKLDGMTPQQAPDNPAAGDWVQSAFDAFAYACHARYWLRHGTVAQKRELFQALGSNLTLTNQKLAVDLHFPLAEITSMIQTCPEIGEGFEPDRKRDFAGRERSFQAMFSSLLRD